MLEQSKESLNHTQGALENERRNIALLNETLGDVELTESEKRSLLWLCSWETSTLENIISVFKKVNNHKKERCLNLKLYEKALEIAKTAHSGQKDKAGKDYIEHPIFVASLVKSEYEKATALLHDVIEDTNISLEDLRAASFPREVVEAVDILTKKQNISYFDYIENVKGNNIARIVKLADLTHNSDLSRLLSPSKHDYNRREKYLIAIDFLNNNEFNSYCDYKKRIAEN